MMYALWIDADQRFAFSLAPVPGAVEITDEHHALMMDAQAIGMVITTDADGRPVAVDPPPPPLDQVRADALTAVVVAAAAARDAWRTPGKDGVYLSKQTEAAAWLAAGRPDDLTGYPYIMAEVGVTAPDAAQLVALWQAMAAAWAVASAEIERAEMQAKAAIAAATTALEIEAVIASVKWPALRVPG